MRIKQVLLVALLFALPIFGWYLFLNRDAFEILNSSIYDSSILVAFLLSSAILLCAHILRAYKTKLLTDNVKVTRLRTHIRALFIGYLFNALLPFRIGEIIRAIVLGKGTRMSTSFMFGLVLFDRALDGLILGLIGIGLLLGTDVLNVSDRLQNIITTASIALILLSILVISLLITIRNQPPKLLLFIHRATTIFNQDLQNSIRFKIWSLMYGLERVFTPRRLIRYVALSLGMWAIYIAALAPLALVISKDSNTQHVVTTSTVSYLGVSVPSGPSHIGSYQTFVQPYVDEQSESEQIRKLLAFAWVLQILPAFMVGLVFVLRTRETLHKPHARTTLESVDDKLLRDVDISHDLGSFLDAFFTNNSLSRTMHRFEVDKNSRLVHYFKGGSNAITALVKEDGKLIVRKITPIQYKYKLHSQYEWLKDKASLKRIVNVIGDETTDSYYKIDLEYNKEYVPFFDYMHSMPVENSKKILGDMYSYLFKYIYKPKKLAYRPEDLESYIEDRCLSKVRQAAEINDEIKSLLQYDKLVINGKTYSNLPVVVDKIKKSKKLQKTLATYRKCSIHGDTTIDNILVTKQNNKFLLIDPTDNENEISGPVFDFGRTTQSLKYGYEFLCRDDRRVEVSGNQVNFEHSSSNQYALLEQELEKLKQQYLTKEEQAAVVFHASVLYSRMLTHRVVINPLNAAKFYAVSVMAFNDFLNEAKK